MSAVVIPLHPFFWHDPLLAIEDKLEVIAVLLGEQLMTHRDGGWCSSRRAGASDRPVPACGPSAGRPLSGSRHVPAEAPVGYEQAAHLRCSA